MIGARNNLKSAFRWIGWLAGLIGVLAVTTARAGDPDLVFSTIETEHFRIHFHQGLEPVARQAATIFEEVHTELTIMFGWEVIETTDVVITDFTDAANGTARSRYRPRIRLFATAPGIERETQQYDHWLRTLIVHEYVHIVSLRIHSGFARVVNAIFGTIFLPNGVLPTWYREGIAVLNETYQTSQGRIRSAEYGMVVRTAALEGTFLSLAHLSNDVRAFPRGTARYLYGAMFFDYLKRRFGMKKVTQMFHHIGGRLMPWGMNRMFKEVYGVDLMTVYRDWTAEVTAEAQQLKERLASRGLTPSRRITWDGEYKGPPVFAPDGRSVILSMSNQLERDGLYRIPLDGRPKEQVALAARWSPASMDRSGALYYIRTAPFKNEYYFSDLFALETPTEQPRRITHGLRVRSAGIAPSGDRLALVVNNAGTTKLVLADSRGQIIRTLLDSAPGDQVYMPSWSPDGKTVAAIIRRGAQVDVGLIDVATGVLKFVTYDPGHEKGPNFDPSGRYLVFSSARTGISNILAYDRQQDKLLQLTNVVTGAYHPAVSPDGKTLAFLKFSSVGYDLHTMPFAPETAPPAPPVTTKAAWSPPVPPPSKAPVRPYNPLPSFLPQYWNLKWSSNTFEEMRLRAETAFADSTSRHRLGVRGSYELEDDIWSAGASYSYRGLGPRLSIGASYETKQRDGDYQVAGESKEWTQDDFRASCRLRFPILAIDRSHELTLGYSVLSARPRNELTVDYNPQDERPEIPDHYFRAGMELGWSYSDVFDSEFGISREKGRRLSAKVELYHPVLGGNRTLAVFKYDWREYVLLPWWRHHVLAIRLSGGVHVANPPNTSGFSAGGYAEESIVDRIWDNEAASNPSLRGYPHDAFEGSQLHALKVEYRFPLFFPELAHGTIPVFLKELHIGVFTDNVVIASEEFDEDDWRSSVGAELVWTLNLGYFLPVTFRLGYARGLMVGGVSEFIFVVGKTF